MVSRRRDRLPFHARGCNPSNLKHISCSVDRTILPTLFCANTRSARYKLNDLRASVRFHQSDIVCVVESWFNDTMEDNCLSLGTDYSTPVRHDRRNRIGGGVATWFHRSFQFKHWHALESDELETSWFTVWSSKMPRKFSRIILGVIYHSATTSDGHRYMNSHITNCIDHIKRSHPYSGVLLVGDFNQFPDRLLTSQLRLKQIIKHPTRGTAILDKCFTDMDSFYKDFAIVPPIGASDHNAIICYPCWISPDSKGEVEIRTTRVRGHNEKALFYHDLRNVRWEPLYYAQSYEDKLGIFCATMSHFIDKHFPFKIVKRHSEDKPWVTDHFKSLVAQRQVAFLKGDLITYRKLRNKVNRMSSKLESSFYSTKVANLTSVDSRNWWKHMKELLGLSSKRNSFDDIAQSECNGDQNALANVFNEFFTSVGSHLSPIADDNAFLCNSFPVPDKYLVRIDEMENRLASIKTNKSTGPDGIPAWILRDLCTVLAKPLTAIANASILEGKVASSWKFANVTPLPKVPTPRDVTKDFRPISITSIPGKAVEYFPVQWMYHAIEDNIDPNQFGGVKDSSTALALLKIVDYVAKHTDKPGTFVQMLLVDFAKAFDLVDHSIVIEKLSRLGVEDCLVKWSANFLKDRRQTVKLGSSCSDVLDLHAGCPQGTLMGPLVFLAHINDLCPPEPVLTIKYVDDTSILYSSSNPDDPTMQNVATYLNTWSSNNQMKFNVSKSKEIIFSFARSCPNIAPIKIDRQTIQRVNSAKILGVTISSDLKWNQHVYDLLKKANKRLFLLNLCRRGGVTVKDMIKIYVTIIRSALEYCAVVWHSSLPKYLSDAVENIQKRALHIILGIDNYQTCLEQSNLQTLWQRREDQCQRLFICMKHPCHKLHDLLPPQRESIYNFRNFNHFNNVTCHTNRYANSFLPYCTKKF